MKNIILKKAKSGWAIYKNNKRLTSFVPDKNSGDVLLRQFEAIPDEYNKKQKKLR